MFGAICGDTLGSTYEWYNVKYCPTAEELLTRPSRFTDDFVMTCAVADGLKNALSEIGAVTVTDDSFNEMIKREITKSLVTFGRKYPNAGYGDSFYNWLLSEVHEPYNSWGNGAAMRVSYAGWIARTLDEAERFGELSAAVTHNYLEGIKAAKVIAGSIFILKIGGKKADVTEYVKMYYDINFTLDDIRADYRFDVSCQGSVPQAIVAFIEGENYVDVVSRAISIGGDSDTIAAIAGSLAEVIYPIPEDILTFVKSKLDAFLLNSITEAAAFVSKRGGYMV